MVHDRFHGLLAIDHHPGNHLGPQVFSAAHVGDAITQNNVIDYFHYNLPDLKKLILNILYCACAAIDKLKVCIALGDNLANRGNMSVRTEKYTSMPLSFYQPSEVPRSKARILRKQCKPVFCCINQMILVVCFGHTDFFTTCHFYTALPKLDGNLLVHMRIKIELQ